MRRSVLGLQKSICPPCPAITVGKQKQLNQQLLKKFLPSAAGSVEQEEGITWVPAGGGDPGQSGSESQGLEGRLGCWECNSCACHQPASVFPSIEEQ